MVLKDENKVMFYVNNYIYWDQFNQLYNLDWLEKDIQNANIIAYKLRLSSAKISSLRLEVDREKTWKKKK